MQADLSCRELALTTVGGALGRMLARLGAAIDGVQCESHDDPQPRPNSFKILHESDDKPNDTTN